MILMMTQTEQKEGLWRKIRQTEHLVCLEISFRTYTHRCCHTAVRETIHWLIVTNRLTNPSSGQSKSKFYSTTYRHEISLTPTLRLGKKRSPITLLLHLPHSQFVEILFFFRRISQFHNECCHAFYLVHSVSWHPLVLSELVYFDIQMLDWTSWHEVRAKMKMNLQQTHKQNITSAKYSWNKSESFTNKSLQPRTCMK